MATTDLHMQVLPRDLHGGNDHHRHGFAHTATLIRAARREATNTLLLDNGDFLNGNGSELTVRTPWQPLHPMIEIMNDLGYDAAAPGNHDFDQGLDYLQTVTGQARFPFVCANALVAGPDGTHTLFDEYIILKRSFYDQNGQKQALRIGITGFLPPNSITQDPENSPYIATNDIIESAHHVVARMRRQGVDLVIALAHTGLGHAEHLPNMENAAIPLAAIDGIDAIISGHRHLVFPGPDWSRTAELDPQRGTVHGKPVVSAGFWGSHLGLIDLELERTGGPASKGGWKVRGHTVTARPVSRRSQTGAVVTLVEPDAKVAQIIKPVHKHILKGLSQPLGHSAERLHSFFALAAPSQAVQLIQRAQLWHMRRVLAETGSEGEAAPLLSSACAFKTGGYGGPDNFTDTKAGPLTMAAIADLYPFPNRLVALSISGAGLRDWLERSASVYNRALPGMVVDLKAPEVPAYLYETVLGLDYAIDLSRPARFDQYGNRFETAHGRIRELTYQGRPIGDSDRFTLITNSYRTGGGGAYPIAQDAKPLALAPIGVQQVLREYIQAHDILEAPLEAHWRFAPLANATMRFRSAPRAVALLSELATQNIRRVGSDAHGYALFDLSL